jgi:hypothetical protein
VHYFLGIGLMTVVVGIFGLTMRGGCLVLSSATNFLLANTKGLSLGSLIAMAFPSFLF